ncbi:hypothetical protein RSAG8_12930, partial [Rhizoctonia solani AG-8 WAC10335]
MPTVLSVGVQLAKHKAIVTRITTIEELAGVTILYSHKTGTLTTNQLTIDKNIVKTCGPFSPRDVILLAAYAPRTENQDAIDQCVIGTLNDPACTRTGIKLLDFKPFNPVDKRTEITYCEESSGKLKRVTKGMTGIIIELCTCNKAEEVENQLEADITDFAGCGLHDLAVAYEEFDHDNFEGEGNSFKLIGLLAIFDPPRGDTKQTIDDAIALGVKVKMVTSDQLAIAKETGGHLGLGDHMYLAKVLKDGPTPSSKQLTLNEMIMDAEGFASVFPKHKYEIVKHLQGLGHLCAMTGDGANDAPALSHANISITVEGATDAACSAADILLTEPGLSTIVHAIKGSCQIFQHMCNYQLFEDKFSDTLEPEVRDNSRKNHNDHQLHMIIYLQVAMISQALIFITCLHGFFMACPSTALLSAFAIAQLISSIIAAYTDWGFTDIHLTSVGWIGIIWIWNIIWFFPLNWIKFGMKATVIYWFCECRECKAHKAAHPSYPHHCAASIHELLYSNLFGSTRTMTLAIKSLST